MKQPSPDRVDPRLFVHGKAARAMTARRRASSDPRAANATVAKVSHTLSSALADQLAAFAFFQSVSESSVIEEALLALFASCTDENELGSFLRKRGAGLRRRST